MTDHGQLVPSDEDLHGRSDEPTEFDTPTERISIAWARDYEERFHGDKYLYVRPRELTALLDTVERARDLADLAAHVVCEPRRFHENTDGDQQLLGEAVARMRGLLTHFDFDHQSKEAAAPVREDSATTSSTKEGV